MVVAEEEALQAEEIASVVAVIRNRVINQMQQLLLNLVRQRVTVMLQPDCKLNIFVSFIFISGLIRSFFRLTVQKDGANKGRKFYRCADDQCQFFQWEDSPGGASNFSNCKYIFERFCVFFINRI
jgi:hypothetical protein